MPRKTKQNDSGAMRLRMERAIRAIPRGKVSTYGGVARAAGYPGAARQVAAILRRGYGLPWQRVLGAGGAIKLTGDSALEQRFRLEAEGVRFRGRRVDMKACEWKFGRPPNNTRSGGGMPWRVGIESTALALAALALLLGCGASSRQPGMQVTGLTQRQVQLGQVVYPFYVFVPSTLTGQHAAPSLLLIHGFGGKGTDMISEWQTFAEANGIILAAPTLPLGGNFETAVAPQLYPMIMDAVRHEWDIDATRIYLFGFSAGGYTVFDAAMLDSQYFAGGGVFAAVITADYDWIVQRATRRIPIAIYIGDHDQFFTVAQAQATSDLLAANGFPVKLKVFPNLDHNYGAVANIVNPDVWSFFLQTPSDNAATPLSTNGSARLDR